MKDFLLDRALAMLLPVVIGFLVRPTLDLLKRGVAWLDKAAPAVKQTMAFVLAGLITALAQALGIGLPTDVAQWDAAIVETVLGGLIAIALKQAKQVEKVKVNAAAIPPTASPTPPGPAPDSPFHLP
jgi:hypothetical protein